MTGPQSPVGGVVKGVTSPQSPVGGVVDKTTKAVDGLLGGNR